MLQKSRIFAAAKGYLARVVRDRSAKPGTAVRVRQVPQKNESPLNVRRAFVLFCGGNVHQAVSAVEFKAEQVIAVAQIQGFGLLARFAAAHPIGIAYAMV